MTTEVRVTGHCAAALRRFVAVLDQARNHNHLTLLSLDGWREECPSEEAWHFSHPSFPDVRVDWYHRQRIEAWTWLVGQTIYTVGATLSRPDNGVWNIEDINFWVGDP